MSIVRAEDIIPLPPGVRSRKALMEHVGFEALQAAHPDHDLFVVAWKTLPGNPFAVVFRCPKGALADRGAMLGIDPVKRWCVVVPDLVKEMDEEAAA